MVFNDLAIPNVWTVIPYKATVKEGAAQKEMRPMNIKNTTVNSDGLKVCDLRSVT